MYVRLERNSPSKTTTESTRSYSSAAVATTCAVARRSIRSVLRLSYLVQPYKSSASSIATKITAGVNLTFMSRVLVPFAIFFQLKRYTYSLYSHISIKTHCRCASHEYFCPNDINKHNELHYPKYDFISQKKWIEKKFSFPFGYKCDLGFFG